MSELRFHPDSHTYYLGDRRLPNVTSIMEPLIDYSGVPRHVLDAAAERGRYVHRACEMLLWEILDEDALEDEYRPYIEGFKKFLDETGFMPHYIEERVYHASLLYAGTIDLAGTLPARGRRKKDRFALIDIKTTFRLMASVGPQTAAYSEAWASHKPKREHFEERYGLQLKNDGTYQLQPFKDLNDFNVFRACLAIHNFIKES